MSEVKTYRVTGRVKLYMKPPVVVFEMPADAKDHEVEEEARKQFLADAEDAVASEATIDDYDYEVEEIKP